ncbi:MAG: hypothetical protein U9N35_02110 [Euryarchaeota archaeon]|nr:hypothetical protein [Euryarchaeota archaeon]
MKRKLGILTMAMMIILIVPQISAFDPEEGFYAEYHTYKNPKWPKACSFALLKNALFEYKFFYLENFSYKYQILDIKEKIAKVRVCFEGEIAPILRNENNEPVLVPFTHVYDLRLDLETLELIDENGDAWGKWLFWIPVGSYDREEYMVMKDWNEHGGVKGWLEGPVENDLHSEFGSLRAETEEYYHLRTLNREEIREGEDPIYPKYENYGIQGSYNAYRTEEGTMVYEGGYYLGGVCAGTEDNWRELEPGLFVNCYYREDGLLLVSDVLYYMDDIINQKLGIDVLKLKGGPLMLMDSGVKDTTAIEEPSPEYQCSSFLDEVEELIEEKNTRSAEENSDKENFSILYYLIPLIVAVMAGIFIVMRERR